MHSRKQRYTGDFRRLSQETAASGIAESTISNVESLRLSRFPAPPSSIPTTPVSSGPPSPVNSSRSRHPPSAAAGAIASSGRATRPLPRPGYVEPNGPPSPAPSSFSPYTRDFSSHDWHEGASSIDVDAAEDRLLSTSFITSLLRDPSGSRASIGSDAFSAFSEMTYPPGNRYQDIPVDVASNSGNARPATRPHGGRAPHPLPAFAPIPENAKYSSDYSETIWDHTKENDQKVPASSIRHSHGASGTQPISVVGVAAATLHNIAPDPRRSRATNDANFPPSAIRSQSRQSDRSARSAAPSFFSKISSTGRSIARVLPWRRVKPLPPVPTIPHIPVAAATAHREREATMSLSHLAARANVLDEMLQQGYNPHQSIQSYENNRLTMTPSGGYSAYRDAWQLSSDPTSMSSHPLSGPDEKARTHQLPMTRRRKKILIACLFLTLVVVAVGVGVGVSMGRKSAEPRCNSGLAGAKCDLNSTCVCTSSTTGRCDGLAQNIVDLTPSMNTLFSTNYSLPAVYNSIWTAEGSPAGKDCSSQANLVDVGANLLNTFSNRTSWAQAAMLWNLAQSQDSASASTLKNFVASAPWSDISFADGPVADDDDSFSVSASGFIFNFATQSVTQPAVSFSVSGQPSSEQIERVGEVASGALDRMYAFAQASSTQRQTALATYWTDVLSLRADDLSVFLSLVASSEIILPFNATVTQTLLSESTEDAFPPPLSCFPGLEAAEVETINTVETSVFGLPTSTAVSQFDTSCYPDRPIYGILNLLQLRLPFANVSNGTPLQGVSLNRDVSPRVVVHSGGLLSSLPGVELSFDQPHPRQFGTLNNLKHVILSYLSSLDTAVAVALVTYVLAYKTVPPTDDSALVQSLTNIPSLEVAVFGSVLPEDISSTVSSFSTSSGALFFGSEASSILRNWTIGQGREVIWADDSISALVAHDSSLTDQTFNEVWSAAEKAVSNDVADVTAEDVIQSLTSIGKMDS